MPTLGEPEINWKGVSLVFLTPALGGFLYGYDIGATSFVFHHLLRDKDHPQDNHTSDVYWWSGFDEQIVLQGLVVGGTSFGALLGSHVVLFHLASWISRRMELRVASLLYLVGTLINITSGTLMKACSSTIGASTLILGRLIFGVGVGFVMHGAPAYMAEMSPTSVRGAVVSAKETVTVMGVVAGYATGSLVDDWTRLYMISCLVSLPFLFLTFFIPRSKRWLLLHGNRGEAVESMKFIYHGDIREEFNRLASHILQRGYHKHQSTPAGDGDSGYSALMNSRFFSAAMKPSLIAAMGLIILQQLSGQPSVLSYATVLFSTAGWTGSASVSAAVLMTVASMIAVLFVDRCGRIRLLSASCVVLGTSALVLAVAFWQSPDNWGQQQKVIVLVALFTYIGGYQVGFGPIAWLIVSEVFPQDVRGVAIALAVELNYLLNFGVQFSIPWFQSLVGWGTTFLLFACCMLCGLVFVQTSIPETTGMTLEEIHQRHVEQPHDEDGDEQPACTEHSLLLDHSQD